MGHIYGPNGGSGHMGQIKQGVEVLGKNARQKLEDMGPLKMGSSA